MEENTEFDVDKAMDRLEAINQKLSGKELSLKESIELYKEGVLLAEECKTHLVGVEQELRIINGGQ